MTEARCPACGAPACVLGADDGFFQLTRHFLRAGQRKAKAASPAPDVPDEPADCDGCDSADE